MTTFHSLHEGQTPDSDPSESGPVSPSPAFLAFSGSEVPVAPIGADFYQAAVVHAGIPIVPLDATGRILAWNDAAVRLFGRNQAEVVGRPLEILIPSEFRPTASHAFQRTIQQRSVNVYEMTILPEGGKHPVHVGVTLSCVIDEKGMLQGVAAWMRDISNRKELESHLTRTRQMAGIGTLAAGVAHHFNNIACGMGTMVEFALATEDKGAMLKALRMATEACTRIRYITQSLLACSGETNGGENPTDPDLSDLTEEVLRFADAVEPTLIQKGIILELDLQARRVAAVPRIRFVQLLQHLLRNAEDAIDQRCTTLIGAQRRITLRTQSQGDQIMLQFADSGCGIDADDLPRIFDPFFTKKGVQGGGNHSNPGLGLTLVHSVVMEMSGHIWADSVPGQGTTLHILIPVVV